MIGFIRTKNMDIISRDFNAYYQVGNQNELRNNSLKCWVYLLSWDRPELNIILAVFFLFNRCDWYFITGFVLLWLRILDFNIFICWFCGDILSCTYWWGLQSMY